MKIKIKIKKQGSDHIETYEVEAQVFGPLALHPDYISSGWRITHIKTGRSLCGRLVYKRSALALIKQLAKRPELFENLSTKDPVKNYSAYQYMTECRSKIASSQAEYLI